MTLLDKLKLAHLMKDKGYISDKTFDTLIKGLFLIESDRG